MGLCNINFTGMDITCLYTSFWEFICDSGCPAVPRHVGRAAKLSMWNLLSLATRVVTLIVTWWNSASRAIFRTTTYTAYANVITTQSSFWRRQALISGPCDQHFSDSHQNSFRFTPKSCFFCRKNIGSIKFSEFREIL